MLLSLIEKRSVIRNEILNNLRKISLTSNNKMAAKLSLKQSFVRVMMLLRGNSLIINLNRETPIVAIDCEMVEVDRCADALARVSIVNYNGHVLYDEFVRPENRITNFRTWVSGVGPHHMHKAKPHKQAKDEVHRILKGKIIVGHSLTGDFRVLEMTETVDKDKVRDTSKYKKYQNAHGQA
jgi:DNA polymerase III alpha subunit (gram-positive type)